MNRSPFLSRVMSAFRLFVLAIGLLTLQPHLPAFAQDETEEEEAPPELMEKPIATIAVASVERLRGDIKHVFEVVDRADVYEAMESALTNVGDLKGMDQTKPFGAMVYLRAGFPPTPEVIGFVPVEDITDLTKTIEIGPVLTKKVDENRYEIIGERGEFHVLLQHGFGFITANADLLENGFSDPAKLTRGLTSKFDIAASLNLDSIPTGMRSLFMTFVKSQANAEMQQRDDEPDGVYKIRRAQSENTLRGLTQIMNELEKATIGFDANPEDSTLSIELILDAQEDSLMAKQLKRMNSKRSYFDPLVTEDAPLTFSASFPIEEPDQETNKLALEGLEELVAVELAEGSEAGNTPAITSLFRALHKTNEEAHLNMFLQFYGEPKGFVIVGGMKVEDGQDMAAGLKELLMKLQEDADLEIGKIELDYDTHRDITFHHFGFKQVDAGGRRMFGERVGLYAGVGRKTLWFAAGGDAALEKTKELMDKLVDEKGNRNRTRRPPFQLIFNMRQWLGLDEDGEGIQHEAFADGGDRLSVDMRPAANGMRIKANMDAGFVRLIGMGAAQGFDRRNERRESRGRGRRPGQ